jgi:hypothetical protein
MPATTVISIDIKDDARASMRGKRFSALLLNPGTVRWVLQLPSPRGQMAEIAQFLREHEAARQVRASEKARAVYLLASDASVTRTTVVDTALVSALISEKGRSDALAGGLRCEQGHVMKFVDEHASGGSTVRAYFAHVTKSDMTASEAHEAHTGPRGRCSDIHLLAQWLIQQNVNRIVATRFKSCGECVELAFRPSGNVRAEIEVTERTSRGTIRSDVVVYEGDERLIAFEVKHMHGTAPTSREGLPYLEVDAAHVVSQVDACASGARIVLKCENATTPCTDGCKARRTLAEVERRLDLTRLHKAQLAAWVESNYERVPLHERDMGTPLLDLYSAYHAGPPFFKFHVTLVPVHVLEFSEFTRILDSIYENIGHWIEHWRDGQYSYMLLYLLRKPRPQMPLSSPEWALSSAEMLEEHKRRLSVWVEANYEHLQLHESDMGTPLHELYAEYATKPNCHALGKSEFARMLRLVYGNVGLWIECRPRTWESNDGRAHYKLRYLLRKPPSPAQHEQGQCCTAAEAEPDTNPEPHEEDDADMYRRMRHEASLVRARHRGMCERRLRAWVESNYEHVPLHRKGLAPRCLCFMLRTRQIRRISRCSARVSLRRCSSRYTRTSGRMGKRSTSYGNRGRTCRYRPQPLLARRRQSNAKAIPHPEPRRSICSSTRTREPRDTRALAALGPTTRERIWSIFIVYPPPQRGARKTVKRDLEA